MGSCISCSTECFAGELEQECNGNEKTGPKTNAIFLPGPFNFEFLRKGGVIGEEDLHRIRSRMFLSGAGSVSSLYTHQGTREVNQDAMLVWEDFGLMEDTIFCGVFDGHGGHGHMVSKKVRDSLPLKICCFWKAIVGNLDLLYGNARVLRNMSSENIASPNSDDEWSESVDTHESTKLPEKHLKLKKSLLKACKLMDEELNQHPEIDSFQSGTTSVMLIKQGQDLVIGNVGDSRAVLGTRDKDNAFAAVQLTVDFKPHLPREAARIERRNGGIYDVEGIRMFSPDGNGGLAMSRAFGDFELKKYGLISVPEISYRLLTEKDEFVILASDGVWDVLSNKDAVDIVASTKCRGAAAKALVDHAVRKWQAETSRDSPPYRDDCTAVCLFLDPSSTTTRDPTNRN